MLFHYTKMALKAFWRYRLHTFINVMSLAFGIFCFIAAMISSAFFSSFDRHFPDSGHIFSLLQGGQFVNTQGSLTREAAYVSKPVADYLRIEFPELKYIARASSPEDYDVTDGGERTYLRARFVEPDFLKVFSLALDGGNAPAGLEPNTALITYAAAMSRFGSADVVGKRLVIARQTEVTIAGVLARPAGLSHIDSSLSWFGADLLVHMETFDYLRALEGVDPAVEDWITPYYFTYLMFDPARGEVDVRAFNERLDAFAAKVVPDNLGYELHWSIQPINQLLLSIASAMLGGNDLSVLLIISGCLVLLVATLNYSTLVNAQLIQRTHEIGVQKIMGAKRNQLLVQYSYEALLLVSTATCIALLLTYLPLSALIGSGITGVSYGLFFSPGIWTVLIMVMAVVILISGAYPALRVSRSQPVELMKTRGAASYSHRLRSFMVGLQFLVSSTMLILLFVVAAQNTFMFDKVVGSEDQQLLIFSEVFQNGGVNPDLFATELRQHPGIKSLTFTEARPWALIPTTTLLSLSPEYNAPKISVMPYIGAHDFFSTVEIPFTAGRDFDESRASDVFPEVAALGERAGPFAVILDTRSAQKLGWEDPADAVGATVYRHLVPPEVPDRIAVQLVIVGVVEHKPLHMLAFGADSTAYLLRPARANNMIVRIDRGNEAATLRYMDEAWEGMAPMAPLQRLFMAQRFRNEHVMFTPLGAIIGGFAAIAFSIASVGLLGMATFITNLRQKEVGIRKVMGAKKFNILRMLMLDYSRPVIIANFIAWPVGFILGSAYLNFFTQRADMTATPFWYSFLITTSVAWLAVGQQALRSSRVRPASVLKHE